MYNNTTDYGVDRRGGAPRPTPSHSSFGCDLPLVPDEAGPQIAAKRVAQLHPPQVAWEGLGLKGTSGIN